MWPLHDIRCGTEPPAAVPALQPAPVQRSPGGVAMAGTAAIGRGAEGSGSGSFRSLSDEKHAESKFIDRGLNSFCESC